MIDYFENPLELDAGASVEWDHRSISVSWTTDGCEWIGYTREHSGGNDEHLSDQLS